MTLEKPFYRQHVFCCNNQRPAGHHRGCCQEKGADKLRNYMKSRAKEVGLSDIRINSAGCLDRCESGPCVLIYPEGIWYSPKNEADCDEIIEKHLKKGEIVERLQIKNEKPNAFA